MTLAITTTVILAFVYFTAAFVRHCAGSICQRHKAVVGQVQPWDEAIATEDEIEDLFADEPAYIAPLELSVGIGPMSIGAAPEISLVVPEKKKDLVALIVQRGLSSKIYALAGKTYSKLSKTELREYTLQAIA